MLPSGMHPRSRTFFSGVINVHNIKKIAQIAGVSKSTVSRVINNHPYVHEDTRAKVLQVISELDYSPNINAIQLKTGTTNIIGIMTPTINNYYMQIIKGMANEARRHAYQVLIYQTEEKLDQEQAALELLRQKKVDGLAILRRLVSWEAVEHYVTYGPIVTCEPTNFPKIPSVYLDHYEGFRIGLEHLVNQGYIKIACTVGRENSVNSQRRIKAYYDILDKYALPHHSDWLVSGVHTAQDGRDAFRKLVCTDDPPQAIMTTSDYVASGIITEARQHGINVPEDLAVIGFQGDEGEIADIMELTHITNPLDRIGQEMFQTFYKQLNHEPTKSIHLACELVVRKST